MFFKSQYENLNLAQDEAQKLFNENNIKPKVTSLNNLSIFFKELAYAYKLIFTEKEIIFFSILQWLVIGLAYLMWTKILDFIPDSLWEEVRKSSHNNDDGSFALVNLVFLGWSFIVVACASYPLALLSAATTASHYLKNSNQNSTIPSCLNIAYAHLGRLWVFTTIDAWITVSAILDRLPKKRHNRTAIDEALYYAWKIGTIGILPALVAGKNYVDCAKDSILIFKNAPLRAVGIRMGYSLVCWIIGIAAYIGSIYYFMVFGETSSDKANEIYNFYFFMTVPIFIATGIISVLIRPFFLIVISKLYTDIITIDQKQIAPLKETKLNTLAVFFIIMLLTLLCMYFFGDKVGLKQWIESLAIEDINIYHELSSS